MIFMWFRVFGKNLFFEIEINSSNSEDKERAFKSGVTDNASPMTALAYRFSDQWEWVTMKRLQSY